MRRLREIERIEDRALAAVQLVDAATGATIDRSLSVRGATGGVRITRNRSGAYVIREWQELAAHAPAFAAPPATPDPGDLGLELRIEDPSGHYLPRRAQLALPRLPDPDDIDEAESLFRAFDVLLYPSPTAPGGANWSLLRLSLSDTDNGDALGGALLRVRRNGEVLARGLTDWRGEALVPVVGVPVTTFSDDEDAVVVSAIEVTIEAFFDPAIGSRTPMSEVLAGRPPPTPLQVDPDAIEAQAASLPNTSLLLSIAARSSLHRDLTLDLP